MDSNHSSLITSPVNSNDITLGGLLQQVDLKCTSELVESTKSDMNTVDESPSSVRRQSSMASRVKSRRQRRNSGVLGVADTLRSKRSSFNAKLDTHSANSTELSSNPVIAVEKPVVDELREIICERLSEAFLDKAVENTSERISINDTIQNSELYQLAINDTDTPLSTPSTAGIRIISVQGQKARIVFNKKPAPPPGQRPLMDNMRSTRMASIGELHHYHQQSTSNAQSTSSLYDGREVPFRHSRSASVPIVDSQHLSGTTLPREFNDQPTQLTLQSSIVNTASTKFNVTLKQRKTHRKSSSLSMAYPTFNKMSMGDNTVSCKNIPQVVIPPTSSQAMAVSRHPPLMVNTSKVNMQKSSLKASTSAIKNASNTSNSNSNSSYHLKLPESTFSSVQSSSRHCTTTNTTNMTSNTHNNTALHTRTTSDPAINKTLVVNHQRSHSQPAIHEVSLADQSLSHQANKTLTHRISTLRNAMLTGTPLDDTSSDTVDALSLHMNTTTLSMLSNVNDKKTPLSPVTEYPQIDWEKLPPWNQVYWNEHPSISLDNNITSNINNDSLNVNKNATQGTHSNTLCDNNNNNSSVLSIDQQLKDASIPMASSMNTMLNNAASITGTTTATATAIATATASTSQPPNNYYNAYLARTCHFGVQGSYQASYNSLSQHVNSTSVSNQISNESEQQKMFNHKSSPLLILITYLKHFDFAETSIDLALRALLLDIPLPRQPEKVDCILIAFSNRFHECNPDMFPSIDVVYSTAFSILLLHADMHGSDAHQCINFEQFINQVNSTDKTQFVASEFLEIIYDNIVTTKLSHAGEQQINQRNNGDTNIDNHGNILGRFLGRNRTNSNSVKSPQRYMQQANKGKLKPQLTIPKADQYSFTPNNSKPSNTQSISQSACFLRISGIKPSLASSIGNHPTEYSLSLLPSHSMPGSEQNSHVQLLCSKQDLVIRKLDQIESGHRSGQRSWVHYWLALCGSQLFLFPDVAWFRDPNHQSILPMAGSVLTDPFMFYI
ncbi:hypothetical protein BDF19DRAFT_41831 [Syncephalis fuscata]|nr:hypothetical protein BDF19DRAFT_41831 [Syncephalis fuscata]